MTKDVIAATNGEPSSKNNFMDLILALRKEKRISGRKGENDYSEKILDITDAVISAQSFIFLQLVMRPALVLWGFYFTN